MPKTVMIVDDYADTREMMRTLISFYGYDVVEAADGSEAIERTLQYRPDLIFMDLALPGMDGATAVKTIRKIEGFEKVSIVALTGFVNTSLERAVETGFDGILVKPLQIEKLEPLLKHYLA